MWLYLGEPRTRACAPVPDAPLAPAARALYLKGDMPATKRALSKALFLRPSDPVLWYDLGITMEQYGVALFNIPVASRCADRDWRHDGGADWCRRPAQVSRERLAGRVGADLRQPVCVAAGRRAESTHAHARMRVHNRIFTSLAANPNAKTMSKVAYASLPQGTRAHVCNSRLMSGLRTCALTDKLEKHATFCKDCADEAGVRHVFAQAPV